MSAEVDDNNNDNDPLSRRPNEANDNDTNENDNIDTAETAALLREREIERWLAAQDDNHHNNNTDEPNDNWLVPRDHDAAPVPRAPPQNESPALLTLTPWYRRVSYVPGSFAVALIVLYYALRSRQQWYLTLVYLSSSKWALVVFGNCAIALTMTIFDHTVKWFLNGLRVQEAEGLHDFFRWNVTESCLALTLFRNELRAITALQFLALVLLKCLHHVAVLRETHLRLTTEGVILVGGAADRDNIAAAGDHAAVGPEHGNHAAPPPPPPPRGILMIPFSHVKVLLFMILLQLVDLYIVQHTAQDLLTNGPSVHVLFLFEAAILLVSAWSHLLLWHLHALDGLLQAGHEQGSKWLSPLLHPWKEYKATLTFAVELQAQTIQFLFYLTFFAIILTYWGMPINLFREVYLSFTALKERLLAFMKYRRLMANMNTQFDNVTDEHLQQAGRVCIICRDEMTVADCKQLPVCHHVFHKSCLREWLVQQQFCPTCRGDITANQVVQANQRAAARAARAREDAWREGVAVQVEEDNVQDTVQVEDTSNNEDNVGSTGLNDSLYQGRGKRSKVTGAVKSVRFAGAQTVAEVQDGVADQKPTTFPALYRVVAENGTTVWSDSIVTDDSHDNDVALDGRRSLRQLDCGVIVLCVKDNSNDKKQTSSNDNNDPLRTPTLLLLRIPDGWVQADDLVRVATL